MMTRYPHVEECSDRSALPYAVATSLHFAVHGCAPGRAEAPDAPRRRGAFSER
jgi:hypothetical protein